MKCQRSVCALTIAIGAHVATAKSCLQKTRVSVVKKWIWATVWIWKVEITLSNFKMTYDGKYLVCNMVLLALYGQNAF